MHDAIQIVALGGAIGCFIVYLVVTLSQIPKAQEKTDEAAKRMTAADGRDFVTPEQATEIIKVLASLAESLAKAGPALWSLIGSLLFLLIAAMTAGLIVGGS